MSSRRRGRLPEKGCHFCGSSDDEEFTFGPMCEFENIILHQNCLFFASGLSQHGDEDDGILGFLLPDIKKELRRGTSLRCFYCKKYGATVGCCDVKCKRTFHFPCGLRNMSLHQFYDAFCSYCDLHKPKQPTPKMNADEFYCHICFASVPPKDRKNCLYSPCCKNNYFHQTCLQKYAFSAGKFFFKCPMCNDSSQFVKEMTMYGISLPEKDASWELEDHAYSELLERPKCGAEPCHCASGCDYEGTSEWKLLTCTDCGSQARHKYCAKLKPKCTSWKCDECKEMQRNVMEESITASEDKGRGVKEELHNQQNFIQINDDIYVTQFSRVASVSNESKSINTVKLSPFKNVTISLNASILPRSADLFDRTAEEIISLDIKNRQSINKTIEKVIDCEIEKMKSNVLNKPQPGSSKNTFEPFVIKCKPEQKIVAKQLHHPNSFKIHRKRKLFIDCCSKSKHMCIKKMFGLECNSNV